VFWVVTPSSRVLITGVSKEPIVSYFMCQLVLLPLRLPTQETRVLNISSTEDSSLSVVLF